MYERLLAASCVAVHPHGRGDNVIAWVIAAGVIGSPPRAWGQSQTGNCSLEPVRFTPTGVGTMVAHSRTRLASSVHPHRRGDNAACGRKILCSNGSPPRAWGQLRTRRPKHEHARFTPTGVGTIAPRACKRLRRPVHPHGRGDNCTMDRNRPGRDGSPPRAWGQCQNVIDLSLDTRFTPTGVGTIVAPPDLALYAAVHPHGRGDNRRIVIRIFGRCGSPPRAWGQSVAAVGVV